ncbi:hypothetical protein HYT00_02720 [Candidatus Giovannonibacteria bacterium]|nr:hypothetical protein [Candidatus Giovannonibacteria bacterium]
MTHLYDDLPKAKAFRRAGKMRESIQDAKILAAALNDPRNQKRINIKVINNLKNI